MLRHRLIPALLLQDGGLYKTRAFAAPKYVGDPVNAIRIFNEKEVDELILLDISASARQRGPDLETIAEVVGECFMPLTYGGGIRSLEDAEAVLALGVEKVSLQTKALEDLHVVTEIAQNFGNQSVIVSIDVDRPRFGKPRLYSARHRKAIAEDWRIFLSQAIVAGAGEILLTAVAREGSMGGMDVDLIRQAAKITTVPLIAHGGVGSLSDIAAGLSAGADAIALGSFVVFKGSRRAVLITYPDRHQIAPLLR